MNIYNLLWASCGIVLSLQCFLFLRNAIAMGSVAQIIFVMIMLIMALYYLKKWWGE